MSLVTVAPTLAPLSTLQFDGRSILQAWSIQCETIIDLVREGTFTNTEAAAAIRGASSRWVRDLHLGDNHRVELLTRTLELLMR